MTNSPLSKFSLVLVSCSLGLGCGDPGVGDDDEVGSESSSDASTDSSDASSSESASETEGETATDTDSGSETGDPDACWTDLAFGETEVFYQGFSSGSEGIAFGADGLLYVTTNEDGDGTLWQFDAQGQRSEFAKVPYALGLAARPEGGFVVASIGLNDPDVDDGAVYVVDAEGPATLLATGIASPNFIALAPEGSAFVSDDFDNTRVFRVTPEGALSVVIENVESPNGMAYSPAGDLFYVASTFTPLGQLTRYEVDGEGLPIEATGVEILQLGQASTPDGIAVDANGMVYVAANIPGQLWRVDGSADTLQDGELVAEGLGSPASLAFGKGPGFDPCSIYLTQLFGGQVIRVAIGVPGAL
ncbi:SMP-30/gluconolactonase/LRE family protein [Nannocystaceae bacterium ST9]